MTGYETGKPVIMIIGFVVYAIMPAIASGVIAADPYPKTDIRP